MNTQTMIEFENFPAEQFTANPVSITENAVIIEFRGQLLKAIKTEEGWKLAYRYGRRIWLTKYQKSLANYKLGELQLFPTASEALKAGMMLKVMEDAYREFNALALEKYKENPSVAKDYSSLASDFEQRLWTVQLRSRRSSARVENLKKDLE